MTKKTKKMKGKIFKAAAITAGLASAAFIAKKVLSRKKKK